MIATTSAVYVQAYQAITGQTFAPDLSGESVLDRIRTALQPYFV
jgi:phosphoribosylaminoimidazole-succinocarboxamide synthase